MAGGVHVHQYEVDAPDICGACLALALKVEEYQTDAPAPMTALKYAVTEKT